MVDIGGWTESRKRKEIAKVKLNISRQELQVEEMKFRKLDLAEQVIIAEENITSAQNEVLRLQAELANIEKIVIK